VCSDRDPLYSEWFLHSVWEDVVGLIVAMVAAPLIEKNLEGICEEVKAKATGSFQVGVMVVPKRPAEHVTFNFKVSEERK
jgi:hypothetical protein